MSTVLPQVAIERARSLFDGEVSSIEVIDTGWSNIAVDINDRWILRFSRGFCPSQFRLETDFLLFAANSVSNRLTVALPTIVRHGPDYQLYRKISGQRLSPQRYRQMTARLSQKDVDLLASTQPVVVGRN